MSEGALLAVEELARSVLDGVPNDGEPARADLGLLPVFADERPLLGLGGYVDWRACGRLTGLLRSGLCTGALGERVLLPGRPNLPMDRIVLYGLGPSREFDRERAVEVGERLVAVARDMRARRVVLAVPSALTQRDLTEALFASVARELERPPIEPVVDAPEPAPTAEVEPAPAPVPSPAADPGAEPGALAPEPEAGAAATPLVVRAPTPPPPREQWWAVAEARLVQRLRRLLSGPPRAAAEESR